jgi:hypothetical protein
MQSEFYLDTRFSSYDFFSSFRTQNNKINKIIYLVLLRGARCVLTLGRHGGVNFWAGTPAGRCVPSERRTLARPAESCEVLVDEYIYETLIKFGPTFHAPYLRPEHSTGRRLHRVSSAGNPLFSNKTIIRNGSSIKLLKLLLKPHVHVTGTLTLIIIG